MRQIVLYGLLSLTCLVCGCAFISDAGRSPSRTGRPQAAIDKEGSGPVKAPLFKKSDFTNQGVSVEEDPVETRLTEARGYLNEKLYDKIPPLLNEITRFDPENKEAADIRNQAYYGMGLVFYSRHQYAAAKEAFGRVSPEYKNTKSLLVSVSTAMEKQADYHYKRGVKFFINEELESAILEWEKVLVLNPGHLKAAEDIENARLLLKKVEKIK